MTKAGRSNWARVACVGGAGAWTTFGDSLPPKVVRASNQKTPYMSGSPLARRRKELRISASTSTDLKNRLAIGGGSIVGRMPMSHSGIVGCPGDWSRAVVGRLGAGSLCSSGSLSNPEIRAPVPTSTETGMSDWKNLRCSRNPWSARPDAVV